MGFKATLGKSIVLIFLILIVVAAGLVWFDYLNVINIKPLFAPIYRLLKLDSGGTAAPLATDDETISIDAERLAVRLEALSLRQEELQRQKQALDSRESELERKGAELDERAIALDEREKSLDAGLSADEIKERRVEENARYLNGMPPADAVAIITEMDDQDAIDVFKKLDELAAATGAQSSVAYWISLIPDRARAAELLRKMALRQ